MIFQGEEFAASSPFLYFADHDDPEIARAVTEGRRREHTLNTDQDSIPDPESPESFELSKLNWSEVTLPPHAEMLQWYRSLIHLRRSNAALMDGDLEKIDVSFDELGKSLVMKRRSLHMLFNFSEITVSMSVPVKSEILLTTDSCIMIAGGQVSLPPHGFAAIRDPG
jgi:maltooligosyltrehalose trehalohydrolase